MTAAPPRVSVVLPVRDGAATLPRALDSLLAQDLDAWELLAVDDHSRDATRALLEHAAARDARIRVLAAPGPGGIVAALNAGIAAARAPFLARMDADDVCAPQRLRLQAAALDADPALDVVACRVAHSGALSPESGYARHVEWQNALLSHDELALGRFIDAPLAHPSVMFRASCVERWGGYRAGPFPEDFELWLRWFEGGARFLKLPHVLLTWVDSRGRLSRTDPRYAPEAFFRVKAPYLARWLARHAPGRPVWAWGAGRLTRRRLDPLQEAGVCVEAFVDIDPNKIGGVRSGRPVVGPDGLPGPGGPFVLGYVGSRGARELCASHLRDRGWREGVDFLLCA
jgi:glycosyltransferase involved in cell wall biosynthesis